MLTSAGWGCMIVILKLSAQIRTGLSVAIVGAVIKGMVVLFVRVPVTTSAYMVSVKGNLNTLANAIWDGPEMIVPLIVVATIIPAVRKVLEFAKNVKTGLWESFASFVNLEATETLQQNKVLHIISLHFHCVLIFDYFLKILKLHLYCFCIVREWIFSG